MQYKIPIQIENEDKIIGPFGLRQLGIILSGFGIAYGIFNNLQPAFVDNATPLYIICGLILFLFVGIAMFNNHEMTFFPFILNFLRLKINGSSRYWKRGIDSYSAMEIGYVQWGQKVVTKKQTTASKSATSFESSISQL